MSDSTDIQQDFNKAPQRFINCRQCIGGKLVSSPLTISSCGLIMPNSPIPDGVEVIDLHNAIVAPGFLELQINGALGFHFAHDKDPAEYKTGIYKLATYLPSTGVTGFFPTIPTVSSDIFKRNLPHLKPQDVEGGASILGAHVEGPFLNPKKKGAHDIAEMYLPSDKSLEEIYDRDNLTNVVKILTLAPELPGALDHIKKLTEDYKIHVSMGHSAATHMEGLAAIKAGANLLTHTYNAMNPMDHREPGLPGLISTPMPPYFSLIADAIHLHPSIVAMTYRSLPTHCILITDSIELSGLPDGTYYPTHSQVPHLQVKTGNKVTIKDTMTLVGTCIGLDECVRNLMLWAAVPVQAAVRCVTENVAMAMGMNDRGKLKVGKRGDFVVISEKGIIEETWVRGERVYTINESHRVEEWLQDVPSPLEISTIDPDDNAVH